MISSQPAQSSAADGGLKTASAPNPFPARLEEAQRFLDAFADRAARDFSAEMMAKNYAEGVMTYHPEPASLEAHRVETLCRKLVGSIFTAIADLRGRAEGVFPLLLEYSRGSKNPLPIWFPEYLSAYQNYKHDRKLQNRHATLKPYLKGESFCDVGCGGGDLVYYLKQHHPAFKVLAGIDILDWRTAAIRDQIGFQELDFTKPGVKSRTRYDTVTCLAVLHHVGNTPAQLGTFIEGMGSAVAPGGRAVVEEDVIISAAEAAVLGLTPQLEEAARTQPLLKKFVESGLEPQRDILRITDVLTNALSVGVPEMPFPCGFQTLCEWKATFEQHGFSVSDIKIKGFVRGNFNQSSHVWFILEKA